MFIIIKDNFVIKKYNIVDNLAYKCFEIYRKNHVYYINLKDNYYFSDKTKSKVLELRNYEILNDDVYYPINIYVYEVDYGIDDFVLYENKKLLIANDDKATIICKDYYLKDYYLYLDGGYVQTNYDISVNGLKYNNEKLSDGDIIDYLGIRIVYYSNFLYINSFNIINNLNELKNNECKIKYQDLEKVKNSFIVNDLYDFKIMPLNEFKCPKKNSAYELIKSIVPNIIMCLSTILLSFVSMYSNMNNTLNKYNGIAYILMPISMAVTGIILPLIFYFYDFIRYKKSYKTAKNEYLKYLIQYEDKLKSDINRYLSSYNAIFFNIELAKERLFCFNKNSEYFMMLSIGKSSISRELEYVLSEDDDIDRHIDSIVNRISSIDNYPLFIDLKQNKIISIITKKIDKLYFLYMFMLELAYKHHYEDLNLAVYSKEDYVFDEIYNLPHLFVNNNRLTLNCEKQIQELNQMKLDRPLVLFIYDEIKFNFTNKNIHVIYLSCDIDDVYKNSDCVVEYLNNKAYLYNKNNKKEFNYFKNETSFNEYFGYLGKIKPYKNETYNIHLRDIINLDVKNNYINQNKTLTCNFAYSNNEILNFDIHESKQGPHGLIGGSTGSGKSELIVSLLLSLCANYSPDYLNIVLIDYKGGGIRESLSYNNIAIPHIVADVSNLDNNVLQRLIICLKNECKYRQELFKTLSKLNNTSIMNIDDYLNNDYDKYELCKLSHLVIVVDEFAQLKKESPEDIKELISISRIGRSLGLHLILATQKPNGVIDDEIWSNSRFKIALKVFDEKDSMDIIKTKDAAYLNNPGSFLLQVNDSLIKAQSIYTKDDINSNDPYVVSLLDNTLVTTKTYKYKHIKTVCESSVFCKRIIEACDYLGVNSRKLDFLPVDSKHRKSLTDSKCLVFGEADDYFNCKRSLVAYGLKDNVLIYSNRKDEINSFLNTLNEFNRQCIVIGSKEFTGNSISDSIVYDDADDIDYLLNCLLSNKNLDLTLVIEDVNCLLSYNESYLDLLCKLCKRSKNMNVNLLFITTSTQLSYRLINSFNNKILIGINDKTDISAFYSCRSKYEGNSFFYNEEPISMVPIKLEQYRVGQSSFTSIIKRIPDNIVPLIENNRYLLGYDIISKERVLSDDDINIISLDDNLLNHYRVYEGINIHIYSHNLKINNNQPILWLGPGIFSQRLFVASNKEDLKDNEGLYIRRGVKKYIRCINYA